MRKSSLRRIQLFFELIILIWRNEPQKQEMRTKFLHVAGVILVFVNQKCALLLNQNHLRLEGAQKF